MDFQAIWQWKFNGLVREHRIASSIAAEAFGFPRAFVLLSLGQASNHGTIRAVSNSKWTLGSVAAIVAIGKFQTLIERKVFVFSLAQSTSPITGSLGSPPSCQIFATNGEKGSIIDVWRERGLPCALGR